MALALPSRIAKLEAAASGRATTTDLTAYRTNPIGFCEDVLKVWLTPDQKAILHACTQPPYRVKVKAGHSVGKTFLLACIALWWYHSRRKSVTITTGPTKQAVKDLLWAEIRLQSKQAGLSTPFLPADCKIWDTEDHWAQGYTAASGEAFQGRHRESMLFLFDEDEGLDPQYYTTTNTMFLPDGEHLWLSCGNPTTTASQSYREEALTINGQPKWSLYTLSCLNHPNVTEALAGRPAPLPNAVSVDQVDGFVSEWCSTINVADKTPTDFEWRPGSGQWWRPGPIGQSRILGLRPTDTTNTIWSEYLFDLACNTRLPSFIESRRIGEETLGWQASEKPELGVDVARYGDDWTVIHGRWGNCSIHHESGNGWATTVTAGRVKVAAQQMAMAWSRDHPDHYPMRPTEVRIKVDADGVGAGVIDQLGEAGYCVVSVSAATVANDASRFGRRRDELWFTTAFRARDGLLDLSRLDQAVQKRLRQQAVSVTYEVDSAGRRWAASKDDMKKLMGRSPDDMDAMNLAYAEDGGGLPTLIRGNQRDTMRRR